MPKNDHHLLQSFTPLNRRGSQNWWPRCSHAHCFNKSPHKCLNLGGKSTAGCLPVRTLIACRQILCNISFIILSIYIFVKKSGLVFLYCFWSLTSLSFILSSLFPLLLHCSIQLFSHKGIGFLLRTDFFSSSLHLIHLSFLFPVYANPYLMRKSSLKALL